MDAARQDLIKAQRLAKAAQHHHQAATDSLKSAREAPDNAAKALGDARSLRSPTETDKERHGRIVAAQRVHDKAVAALEQARKAFADTKAEQTNATKVEADASEALSNAVKSRPRRDNPRTAKQKAKRPTDQAPHWQKKGQRLGEDPSA